MQAFSRSRLPFQVRQEMIVPILEKSVELNYKPNRFLTECVRSCLAVMESIDTIGLREPQFLVLEIVSLYRAVTGRSELRNTFTPESEFFGTSGKVLVSQSQKRLKEFRAKGKIPERMTGLLSYRITEDTKKRAKGFGTTPNDFINRCVESCLIAMDARSDYEIAPLIATYRQERLKTHVDPWLFPSKSKTPTGHQEHVEPILMEAEYLLRHCEAIAKEKNIALPLAMRQLIEESYRRFRTQSRP